MECDWLIDWIGLDGMEFLFIFWANSVKIIIIIFFSNKNNLKRMSDKLKQITLTM